MNNWIAYYNEQQNSLTARSVMVFCLVEGVTVSVKDRSDLFVLWTSENSDGVLRREGTCDEALRTSACDIKGVQCKRVLSKGIWVSFLAKFSFHTFSTNMSHAPEKI